MARDRSETGYKVLQTVAIALLLMLAAGILQIGGGPYIAFAFSGSFLVFAASGATGRPLKTELLICAALALGFAAVYHFSHGSITYFFGCKIAIPGAFLGMGAVQLSAVRWIWSRAAQKRFELTNMLHCALIPLLCIGSMIAVGLAAYVTPVTYDRVVFAFDLHLDPAAPSWKLGTFFRAHFWFYYLCGHVYNSLPLALSACLALQWRELQWGERVNRFPVDLGITFLTLGVIGFGLYQICPVCGPSYLFPHDYPAHLPTITNPGPAPLPVFPRNGMPSLHVGWTFLVLWNLRTRRILGPLAAIFLTLTALATMGFGEHYLADLIVAIPLALTVQAAVLKSRSEWRLAALATGGLITLGWLIAFRTGIALSLPSGGPLWAIVAATILLPLALVWQSESVVRVPVQSASARLVPASDEAAL
jgi:hypothetical protein